MCCVQTIPCHYVLVLDLWIPFDMGMMWVEVLLSVGAQCDLVSNLKVYVRKCKFIFWPR